MNAKNKEKEPPTLFSKSLLNEWKSRYLEEAPFIDLLPEGSLKHIPIIHPLIGEITAYLQNIIIEEELKGINILREKAERHLKTIEKAFHNFLFGRIRYFGRPNKGILVLRKLEPDSTLDASHRHLRAVHNKHKKQIKQESKVLRSLIQKEAGRLNFLQQEERKSLKSRIREWKEELKVPGHERAKKKGH